jgi:proteasome beta subunit
VTLIVGYIGPDGALMAADSQATEADATRHTVAKIWTAGGLLFGYSGAMSVRDVIQTAVDSAATSLATAGVISRLATKSQLCQVIRPVLKQEYDIFVPLPWETHEKLSGALMVIGRDSDGYWLLEIDKNVCATFYTERGFHAIGSGSATAQVGRALLDNYQPKQSTLGELRLFAYRTLSACIAVTAHGLGEPIQMWTASEGGFSLVPDAEREAIRDGVEQWSLLERESLRQVIAADTASELPPPLVAKD